MLGITSTHLSPYLLTWCAVQQEFEAEQEYIKTLSYLSAEEQRKYKDRQSVSFMYQKPPGMDAAIGKVQSRYVL